MVKGFIKELSLMIFGNPILMKLRNLLVRIWLFVIRLLFVRLQFINYYSIEMMSIWKNYET